MLAADDSARVIAGGQTLVPMMVMRLARPTRLIDINRIAGLAGIRQDGDTVSIGAMTRQCTVERDVLVATRVPLLAKAMPWIGHAATRARGTIGGSLANADPAAEIDLVAVTLDASVTYRNGKDGGKIPARKFFVAAMTTALPSAACLTGVEFPVWHGKRIGVGFHEVNARRSDFAFVSAAAQVELDDAGTCRRIAIGVGAATECPIRLDGAEKQLAGTKLDERAVKDAARAALADIEPLSDLHASADYRRRVAVTLVTRAVMDANANAQGKRHAH